MLIWSYLVFNDRAYSLKVILSAGLLTKEPIANKKRPERQWSQYTEGWIGVKLIQISLIYRLKTKENGPV